MPRTSWCGGTCCASVRRRFASLQYSQLSNSIGRLEVPAGVTHNLVRQFLLHFGYADTLRAFDSAAGVLPDGNAAPAERSDSVPQLVRLFCCRIAGALYGSYRNSDFCQGTRQGMNMCCSANEHVLHRLSIKKPCLLCCSPDCPELALRHAARKAIDKGDAWEAERLVRESQYAHLLDPPQRAADDAAAVAAAGRAADGAAAAEPASADASASQPAADGSSSHGGRPAAGSGGGTAADAAADVHLHLSCQKFVELVRGGRSDEAVEFGHQVHELVDPDFLHTEEILAPSNLAVHSRDAGPRMQHSCDWHGACCTRSVSQGPPQLHWGHSRTPMSRQNVEIVLPHRCWVRSCGCRRRTAKLSPASLRSSHTRC